MKNKNAASSLLGFFIVCTIQITAYSADLSLISIEKYVDKLKSEEAEGGTLYCRNKAGSGEEYRYNNCNQFTALKKQGCYGKSTYEMSLEISYHKACEEIDAIKQAIPAGRNYFNLNSPDWWKSLPAEIIPMPGGIYSDDSWARAKAERKNLVSGKHLGEAEVLSKKVENGEIELVFKIHKEDCGEIRDTMRFSAVLMADFDHDGIAELLIKGFRRDQSDSCQTGTGSGLGAGFSALVKRTGPNLKPVLLPYPSK